MRKQRGAILVTSLWILSILSILAMGIGFRISIEARLSMYYMDKVKALYLAKAGAFKSLGRLSKSSNAYDSIYECGITLSSEEKNEPDKHKAIFDASLGEGSFAVGYKEGDAAYPGMMDEERKININTAQAPLLENLFGEGGGTAALAVVNWRTPGQAASMGEKTGLDHSYPVKHAPLGAIEELLLVGGMTPELLNSVKDYVTVYGPGDKVNINTASKKVLSVLIVTYAGADKTAADNYADRVIDFRNGSDKKPGTKDDVIFAAPDMNILDGILSGLPVQGEKGIAELKNHLTVKSANFRIESTGVIPKSKIEKKIVCVVNKDTWENFKFLYYHEY